MNNFDLHDQAQQLADTRSSYSLALELLELQARRPVWRNTSSHPNGLRRFMTQKRYDAQTPGVQQWYEPIRYEAPEGWKLVPYTPTHDMKVASIRVSVGEPEFCGVVLTVDEVSNIYLAMLSAAPKPGEL